MGSKQEQHSACPERDSTAKALHPAGPGPPGRDMTIADSEGCVVGRSSRPSLQVETLSNPRTLPPKTTGIAAQETFRLALHVRTTRENKRASPATQASGPLGHCRES